MVIRVSFIPSFPSGTIFSLSTCMLRWKTLHFVSDCFRVSNRDIFESPSEFFLIFHSLEPILSINSNSLRVSKKSNILSSKELKP